MTRSGGPRFKQPCSCPSGRVLAFLFRYGGEHGYMPSLPEIASGCDLSPSGAKYHLENFEQDGLLVRQLATARAYAFTRAGLKRAKAAARGE